MALILAGEDPPITEAATDLSASMAASPQGQQFDPRFAFTGIATYRFELSLSLWP